MAAGIIVIPSLFPARDRFGWLVPGAKLGVYVNRTTTKAAIFSDEALTTPLDNPVVANSSGNFPLIWANAGTTESPVLYTVGISGPDGQSIANPSVFHDWQPSLDADVAAVTLANAAAIAAGNSATASEASAVRSEDAAGVSEGVLAAIEAIIENAPEAPSVLNKADRDGGNITSASAWQAALGLGNSAPLNVGTTSGTVAAGDDPRFGDLSDKADIDGANITDPPTFRTNIGAASIASVGNKIDKDAGNMSAPEKVAFRTAMTLVRGVTAEQGADATAAAIAAYAAGIPYFHGGNDPVRVPLNFSGAATDAARFAILDAAQKWQASCVTTGFGDIVLVIPDGLHKFGTEAILRGANSPTLVLDATAAPDELDVTAISVAAISGTLYTVTVTVGAALPAQVVVDYPVGMQAITGNNDAASFNGGLKVTTIAGNRLSFTAQMHFASVPTAPSSLTAGTTNSVTHNRLIIPKAALGWSGGTAAIEGFINFLDGGRGQDTNLGWSYYGSATNGTIFYLGQGASWDSANMSVYVGGPERIFRLFNDALYTANRACLGGGNHSTTNALVDSQSGGKMTIKRCSMGGAILRQVLIGQGTQAELAQDWITGGSEIIRVTGGWLTDLSQTILHHGGSRGIYALQGAVVLLQTTTLISKATTGLAWLGLCRYEGNPTFGTGITNQGTGPANSMRAGGMWQATTTAPVFSNLLNLNPGSGATPANNGDIEIAFTSNTVLTLRGKGTDGVVRSGTITLT